MAHQIVRKIAEGAGDVVAHEDIVLGATGWAHSRSVRLVADESGDFSVVIELRRLGHDVIAIAETMSGADDGTVIALANSDGWLLITEDKDFSRLVFAAARSHSGVILVRYPATVRTNLRADVIKLPAERTNALYGCFAVLEPGRARVTTTVT